MAHSTKPPRVYDPRLIKSGGRNKSQEWIGDHDNAKIPQEVKRRVAQRACGQCQYCRVKIRYGGEIDHVVPLEDYVKSHPDDTGHRETNLQLLCKSCHLLKTGKEATTRAKYRRLQKNLGPVRREQTEWSKKYQKMKEWKRQQEEAGE
jgi:5-methylcytosine-specific restriction endonuclease McrA